MKALVRYMVRRWLPRDPIARAMVLCMWAILAMVFAVVVVGFVAGDGNHAADAGECDNGVFVYPGIRIGDDC